MLMDINKIQGFLPHRYPFLLVDRVLEADENTLIGIKNVTINEPFFNGHFPGHPVMPGVLILEAMAQACGLLGFHKEEKLQGNWIFYLVGIDNARFKRPVTAGDQLRLEAIHKRTIRGLWIFETRATVDGNLVAEAEVRCTVREAE